MNDPEGADKFSLGITYELHNPMRGSGFALPLPQSIRCVHKGITEDGQKFIKMVVKLKNI